MSDWILPITYTLAALCAIGMMVIVGWVGVKRGSLNVRRGDGGDLRRVALRF